MILEGAQGVLLDPERGFWPHVTKTRTTTQNARLLLQGKVPEEKICALGVLRAYATRHGAGPFVTEDQALSERLPELHNGLHPWQGPFRVGWLDLVALRYALRVSGGVDLLAITHVDRALELGALRVCVAYEIEACQRDRLDAFFDCERKSGKIRLKNIKVPATARRDHQRKLTELLWRCRPIYRSIELPSIAPLKLLLESAEGLATPVAALSYGAGAGDSFELLRRKP